MCGDHIGEDVPSGSTSSLERMAYNENREPGSASSCVCIESLTDGFTSTYSRNPGYSTTKEALIKCRHQRYRRSPTASVACQTDYCEEFPHPLSQRIQEPAGESTPSSSEGVLRLMIQNFRSMADTVRGPSKRIQGICWRIMVMPRQHVVQKKGTQKCLGFFLQCCPNAFSDAWSCQAAAELRLISQKPGVPHFTRKTNHNYTSKENDWGYSCFMTWADILDEAQGYIKDDRVILEVTVKAEAPKNILSFEEFQKSIQSWIDLAEMQFSRGCIDLAIEANAQALKFCKEKDAAIKSRLEEQKSFFIEQKLMDSIQRIEKGKQTPKGCDDEVVTQSALKQALTSDNLKQIRSREKFKKVKKLANDCYSVSPPNEAVDNKGGKERNSSNGDLSVSTVRDVRTPEIVGNFNEELFASYPLFNSSPRRSQNEDELYASLAKQLEDSLGRLHLCGSENEKNGFCTQNRNEQLSTCNSESCWVSEQQTKSFAGNVFDVEFHRQSVIKRATVEALNFQENFSKLRKGDSDSFDSSSVSVCLELLWSDGKVEERLSIVDREAKFLDAKIRLFWTDELGSGLNYHALLESDRHYDGSIEAKRSKLDKRACYCSQRTPRSVESVNCSEMGVQTEALTRSAVRYKLNSSEQTRKTNSTPAGATQPRQVLNEVSLQKQTESAPSTLTNTYDLSKCDDTENNGQAIAGEDSKEKCPFIPRVLPMEYAMEFYRDVVASTENKTVNGDTQCSMKVVKDWIRSYLVDFDKSGCEQDINLPSKYSPSFLSNADSKRNLQHPQVGPALSAVAMNFVNTRRVINKLDDLLLEIVDSRSSGLGRKMVASLAKLAGMSIEAAANPSDPDLLLDDLSTIVKNENMNEDYILIRQLNHLDALLKALNRFHFVEKTDFRKMQQAVSLIEGRFQSGTKQNEELEKSVYEMDKQLSKLERQIKADTNALKVQVQSEKDKNTSLAKEIKEKNKEIRKLESKVSSLSSERDDALTKAKQLQKNSQSVQKKASDENMKLKKELNNMMEGKKQMLADISSRDAGLRAVSRQLEDRDVVLKRLKHELEQEKERRLAATEQLRVTTERATNAEIALLKRDLEGGIALLERARSDAKKHVKDMNEAASSKARNQTEINNFITNSKEWSAIVGKIDGLIAESKAEFQNSMDLIKAGKSLSSLPTLVVPKPPPAPPTVKAPPIVCVEPTKSVPGVIGSRTQGDLIPSVVTPTKTCGSSGDPSVGKCAVSPAKHPGAIGTGRDGLPVNGSQMEQRVEEGVASSHRPASSQSAANMLSSWLWPDPVNASEIPHLSPSANRLSFLSPFSRIDQNGWDERNNTWSSTPASQRYPMSVASCGPVQSQGWHLPAGAPQLPHHRPPPDQWSQFMQNPWPLVTDRLMKTLHCDYEAALLSLTEFVRENNMNVMLLNPDEIAEAIMRKHCNDSTRIARSVAPAYLHHAQLGSFVDGAVGAAFDVSRNDDVNGTSSEKWQ